MTQYVRYEDVEVGDVYPGAPLAFRVSAAAVDAFLEATGDEGSLYRQGDGVRRAPSMIASVYLIDLLAARHSPPGGVHAKQSIRFHRALSVGEDLHIQAHVVDKYIRKERPYVVSEFTAKGADGMLAATGRITSIWGKDQ